MIWYLIIWVGSSQVMVGEGWAGLLVWWVFLKITCLLLGVEITCSVVGRLWSDCFCVFSHCVIKCKRCLLGNKVVWCDVVLGVVCGDQVANSIASATGATGAYDAW